VRFNTDKASLPRSEASRSEEEYAINHLAGALLLLDDGPGAYFP
jgi:hypothetical protein